MGGRPTRVAYACCLLALAGAVAVAIWRAEPDSFDPAPLLTLAGLAIAADLTSMHTIATRVRVSGSFIAITVAVIILGPTPAAVIGVAAILAGIPRSRASVYEQLVNVATYAWFPLIAGIAFQEATSALDTGPSESLFYVLAFGAFALALAANFTAIASSACYLERGSFIAQVRRSLLPILPSELISALLAVSIAYFYWKLGLTTLLLLGIVLVSFQYLLGALLVSRQRGDELALRAEQLAGFQVGLLSALVRTLDLRDRMTARHSAAVARYAREIARSIGLSKREQELAHIAGLLHDIGKFAFPDRLLSGKDYKLTEEDWGIIHRHSYEGAVIVSQIDGYQPVGEIILAHHERPDGGGYPRGLKGEEIPIVARIISVADTYDVMTARDSYRTPVSSYEAIEELRRVSDTQLDGRIVDVFIEILDRKDLTYRHGEDADFDAELALEHRIHEYVTTGTAHRTRL